MTKENISKTVDKSEKKIYNYRRKKISALAHESIHLSAHAEGKEGQI